MILRFYQGSWKEEKSLFEALNFTTKQEILSLTGAGGKTTVIRRLQRELQERGVFHGVSTTAHMQYQRTESFLDEASLEGFLECYRKTGTVWMGQPVSEEKMCGFSVDFYEKVIKTGAWLLLEADGARKLPVKAPEEWEPVLLLQTTVVCNVYGLDGLGKTIAKSCFRKEKAADLLGKKETDVLEPEDLVRLGSSPFGGKKLVGKRPYHVILNKADECGEQEKARWIAEKLAEHGVENVCITSDLMERCDGF